MADQNVCKLDEYFKHIPAEEADNKEQVISQLRDWIRTQSHLPIISDRQISMFLHSCYGDLELTKNTIEQYYTQRTQSSDIFSNRKIEELKAYLHVSYVYKDTHLSVDGHQILHIGFTDTDSSKFEPYISIKMICALLDLYTNLMPHASGWRLCVDVKCISFGHYMKLTSSINLSRKFIYYLTTALPIRLKGIHIRNANSFMCQFINMLKPFMKKEIFELIQLHSASDENLYKYVPRVAIPYQDYDNLSESTDRLIRTSLALLNEYEKWFEDDERLARIDETKRAKAPANKVAKGTSFFRSFIGGKAES